MKFNSNEMSQSLSRIGFWSGILTAIFTIWFTVAFFAWYAVSPPSEWQDIQTYAAAFQSAPFLVWVVPCVLLALTFPVLMASIYLLASREKKIWGLLGLIFALIYAAILGFNYWIQLAVVSPALAAGHTEGLTPFIIGSPVSIAFSLEGLGYSLMGLSMLFAGLVFSGGRLEIWIRRLLLLNGIQVAVVIAGFLNLWVVTMISLVIWCLSFPVVAVLLAILFRRAGRSSQNLASW